jgi:[ribosomal protein S5]-alanine N-acetyltransferase
MLTPDPVTTARLALSLWSAADVASIRAGERRDGWHPEFPREDDVDAAGLWHDGDPWGPRSIVAIEGGVGEVVGSVGFFGPPEPYADDGVPETEVGYGLVAPARGAGYATEALAALLVLTDAAGVRIRASVLPTNQPSIRVLAKCGFTDLRGTTGDGELVMVRPVR